MLPELWCKFGECVNNCAVQCSYIDQCMLKSTRKSVDNYVWKQSSNYIPEAQPLETPQPEVSHRILVKSILAFVKTDDDITVPNDSISGVISDPVYKQIMENLL